MQGDKKSPVAFRLSELSVGDVLPCLGIEVLATLILILMFKRD